SDKEPMVEENTIRPGKCAESKGSDNGIEPAPFIRETLTRT
ncbi:MAG: hypothetical protein QOD93_1988, partial [Acetobacteraceae bacterium]|nr:hypothetical protein [Acetobacteraceae bacterium]